MGGQADQQPNQQLYQQPYQWQWQPPIAPQAWSDGDELVIRAGTPLPPICVFCGAPAVAGLRHAIRTRQPFAGLQVLGTRLPVCDDDRRAHRFIVVRMTLWVIVGFLVLMFTGVLPGPAGLVVSALNPYGGTLPGVRAVSLAVVLSLAGWLVRMLLRGSGEAPRPLWLRYHRSQGGFIWLQGADPRCLAQLPSTAPPR